MPRFDRLLITGAAGNLGRELRRGLAPLARVRRLTDRAEMAPAGEGEEVVQADVGDFDAMMKVVEGCDAVVHFGAAPVERPWEEILNSSIKGGYNVYEAARRHGIKRDRLRQLDPRRRLRPPRGRRRHRHRAPAGHALRALEMLRRGPGKAIFHEIRHRERVPAHQLVLPGAGRQAPPRHLDEFSRPDPAGHALADRRARRLHRRLRHQRQPRALLLEREGAPPRLCPAGLGRGVSRRRSRPRRSPATPSIRPSSSPAASSATTATRTTNPAEAPRKPAPEADAAGPAVQCDGSERALPGFVLRQPSSRMPSSTEPRLDLYRILCIYVGKVRRPPWMSSPTRMRALPSRT